SEGSGNGSEDPSKDSGEGSCSDSEENILEEELNEDIKVKEEQLKNSAEEEILSSEKQLIKVEKKEEEENGERPRKKKEKEKEKEKDKEKEREKDKEKATTSDNVAASAASTTPATSPPAANTSPSVPTTTTTEEQVSEPKKWNLRRNRPLLDFVSMEELNDMDDYDSEDDNDWRPTVVKRKGRSASQKEGSDGDNEDDEDEGSGSDEDENDEGNDEDHSSPASEGGCKKKKSKVLSRNSADDEELTNDSLTLSQSKSNEGSDYIQNGKADEGLWVHIVCALYVPGVAFGDIDKLRPVTLTEMNYSKYGAKDIADPFFAYCKQHADRLDRKWKRKNYLALQSYCKMSLQEREKQLSPEAQARINARLQQYRAKAELARSTRPQAWVPREKLPRPLTSSASAIRKLMRKAELMGISTDIFPVDNSDTSSSVDGRRKHKQPALTADFVNYYFERNMRMIQIQENMAEQKNIKDKLENEQEKLHVEYNKLCESLEELQNLNGKLRIVEFVRRTMISIFFYCVIPVNSITILDVWTLLLQGCQERPKTVIECDQAGSSDMEADMAMETLPDGTKRSRRQIKEPVKFVPQDMPPEPKKIPIRNTRTRGRKRSFIPEEEKHEEDENEAERKNTSQELNMEQKNPKK
ncbi:hypothetical protein EI555_013803, partial [Monodon monoceros]